MRLGDLPFLLDQNIRQEALPELWSVLSSVQHARQVGLAVSTDREILRWCREEGSVVLTHDADFGRLAIASGEPLIGIVYLRPGNLSATEVSKAVALVANSEVNPPFIYVIRVGEPYPTIRYRQL